jgi:hypothetical protein
MLGGRTRVALEREKTLVLRSIKELEFDRGMGKVSDKDFVEMSARLRARAARLMRQLDAGSVYREQIEREIAKRIGAGPAQQEAAAGAASAKQEPVVAAAPAKQEPVVAAAPAKPDPAQGNPVGRVPLAPSDAEGAGGPAGPAICPSCDTQNDRDARFCKACGTRLEAAS